MRVAATEGDFLSAAGVYFGSCKPPGASWIYPHPPVSPGEYLVRGRDQAAFDGRIQPPSRGRERIHGHPHLQEQSQVACGILDRHGCILSRLTPIHFSVRASLRTIEKNTTPKFTD